MAAVRHESSPQTASAIAWGAVAASVLGLSFTRITSPDLGFLIATGGAIRALGAIPATNVLSFTEPNHPWLLHEWIPSLAFELAWRHGGPTAVLALKAIVLVATWSLVLATARRLGASPIVAALATLLGAGAASLRFTERPQIFSNLVLAGVALLLAWARSSDGSRRVRFVVAAGAIAAIGAQVHAGALTSLLLMGAVAGGLGMESPGTRSSGLRLFGVAICAAVAAALAMALYHPHGARPLLVPFQLGLDATLREHVIEYRSPVRFPAIDLGFYWLLLGLSIVPFTRSRSARRVGPALLVPLAVFAALSLRHVRTIDAFAIVAAPVLAVTLEGLLAVPPPRSAWVAVAVAALGLPIHHWRAFPPGPGFVEAVWPTKLFGFMAREHLEGPAFVSDGWAGPYLAERYPRERAFFDPRFEAYSDSFVRDVYQRVRAGEPGWEAQLDRYGVQLVLLKYTSPGEALTEGNRENLRQRLVASEAWALVGFGDGGEVFVRREGVNAEAAKTLAIPSVDPDRGSFVGPAASASQPLLRAIDRGLDDTRVVVLAALASADAGDIALAKRLLDAANARTPGDPTVARARRAIGSGAASP